MDSEGGNEEGVKGSSTQKGRYKEGKGGEIEWRRSGRDVRGRVREREMESKGGGRGGGGKVRGEVRGGLKGC